MANSRNIHLCSAAALLVASCASITTGTTQTILIETLEVEGAECELADSKNGHWYLRGTPGLVTVKKGDGPMSIICRKDGYETSTATLKEEVAGAVFGNILIGGVIGIIIDSATGAAQRYPDKIVVLLEPSEFASAEEEAEWRKGRREYEGMFEAPVTAPAGTAAAPAARVVDPSRRARVVTYLENNKRDFENAMLDFDRSNPYAFNERTAKLRRPRIHSYDVWEANEKKIVLRVGYRGSHWSNSSPKTKLLLVRWVGDDLEVVAQRDAPRKDAASW